MAEALKEARLALAINEVPVGALVVYKRRIIGRGHNLTERLKDVTAHAEMLAFTAAATYLGSKYLKGCTLYVTIEPCIMCAGAAFWTQIDRVVFGAYDVKQGFRRLGRQIIHPKTEVIAGVLREECSKIIQTFFLKKRDALQ